MLSFLFPPVCPLCGKTLLDKGERTCKICEKKIQFLKGPTCYSCGKPIFDETEEYCEDCRRHPKNFERGIGLCVYREPVTRSLWAIKYQNKRTFARYYIEEIRKRKSKQLKELGADLIIPVPIHAKKRKRRGFNQAEIFADGIAEIIGRKVEPNLVQRVHETKPQKQLNPKQRRQNLEHAFRGNRELYQKLKCPKKVLVVDDIYTTGATSWAVTKALKDLGVREVYIFCVAIGQGFS